MPVFNNRASGYATLGELAIDLIQDLIYGNTGKPATAPTISAGAGITGAQGFRLIYPYAIPTKSANLDTATGYFKSTTYYTNPITGDTIPVARYILEATNYVDVVAGNAGTSITQTAPATYTFGTTTLTNSWRICIEFPLPVDPVIYSGPTTSTTSTTTTSTTPSPGVFTTTPGTGPAVIFKDFISVYVGSSVQLRNDGTVVSVPEIPVSSPSTVISFLEPAGLVGAGYRTPLYGSISDSMKAVKPPVNSNGLPTIGVLATGKTASGITTTTSTTPAPGTTPTFTDNTSANAPTWDVGFYNRIGVDKTSGYAVPLNYEVTMSKRGVFFGIWDVLSEQSGAKFNWVLVQRSVDRASGAIRGRVKTTEFGVDDYTKNVESFLITTANSVNPVWCVNCVNNKYYKFNPREKDIGAPSPRTNATDNTEDSTSIINPFDQQSLTDDSKYVITFLSNLNTSRFKYPDELDLVGTVSADVIGNGTEATVTVYNEPIDRVYRALPPNQPYGTGMRLVSFVRWTRSFTIISANNTTASGSGVAEIEFNSWPPAPPASAPGTTTTSAPSSAILTLFQTGDIIIVDGFGAEALAFNGTFTVVSYTPGAATSKLTYNISATTTLAPSTLGILTGTIKNGPMSETP